MIAGRFGIQTIYLRVRLFHLLPPYLWVAQLSGEDAPAWTEAAGTAAMQEKAGGQGSPPLMLEFKDFSSEPRSLPKRMQGA